GPAGGLRGRHSDPGGCSADGAHIPDAGAAALPVHDGRRLELRFFGAIFPHPMASTSSPGMPWLVPSTVTRPKTAGCMSCTVRVLSLGGRFRASLIWGRERSVSTAISGCQVPAAEQFSELLAVSLARTNVLCPAPRTTLE